MKRSKIIRLIQKEIYSITQEDILYDSFGFSRNLLDKLESAGMLPPRITDVPEERVLDLGKHKWEPEDEKK